MIGQRAPTTRETRGAPEDRPDLIVVGAGTAGLACAIEAAGRGAKVLLVEKSGEIGGTLHVSGGHMSAAGTKRQRERGIEDDPGSHAADVERISRGTARMDLVRLAVEHAAGTVDWLADSGFEFHESCPRIVHGHEPYSVPRTYYGTDEARSILEVLRRLVRPHVESGRVRLWLGSPARGLGVENGAVVGVEVERRGAVEEVRARTAVVLATGGYGSNPELFYELEGRPLYTAAPFCGGISLTPALTSGRLLGQRLGTMARARQP
jgi:succinate dehydrogenase/fumarate reductase flavoprotein subunit